MYYAKNGVGIVRIMAHIIIAYLAKLSGVLTSQSCSEFKCGHKSDKSDNTATSGRSVSAARVVNFSEEMYRWSSFYTILKLGKSRVLLNHTNFNTYSSN